MLFLVLAGCITELPQLTEPCAEIPNPGLYKLTMEEEGRTVLVNLPDTVGPRPTVVMLHGFGSSATKMRDVTRFGAVGEDEGFVAVFPNGVGAALGVNRSWNAGDCCPPAINRDIADREFLDKVVATLEERVCTDPARTYAAGFSNGAMMALRMACESERIDGVVSAAGTLVVDECDGTPVPTMLVHGLADDTVKFDGGTVQGNDGQIEYKSSDATLDVFLERNQCDPEPTLVDVGSAVCEEYACEVPVRRCTIEGWNHRWPGGVHTQKAGFNLTRESWAFFDGQEL